MLAFLDLVPTLLWYLSLIARAFYHPDVLEPFLQNYGFAMSILYFFSSLVWLFVIYVWARKPDLVVETKLTDLDANQSKGMRWLGYGMLLFLALTGLDWFAFVSLAWFLAITDFVVYLSKYLASEEGR